MFFKKKVSAYERFGKKWTFMNPVLAWDKIRRIKTWNDYSFTRLLASAKRGRK